MNSGSGEQEMSTAELEAMERAWQETRRFSSTSADLVEYRKGWRAGRAYSEQEGAKGVQTADIEGRMGVSPAASEWTFCARCQHVYGTDDEGCCPCLLRGGEPFAIHVVPAERAEQELQVERDSHEHTAWAHMETMNEAKVIYDALAELLRLNDHRVLGVQKALAWKAAREALGETSGFVEADEKKPNTTTSGSSE